MATATMSRAVFCLAAFLVAALAVAWVQAGRIDTLTAQNAKQAAEIAVWDRVADQLTKQIEAANTAMDVREAKQGDADARREQMRRATDAVVRRDQDSGAWHRALVPAAVRGLLRGDAARGGETDAAAAVDGGYADANF